MKRRINHIKIKELLIKTGKKQKELALCIGCSEPQLSSGLKNKRQIPMGYVFDIASFFKVNPLSITR